MPIEIVAALSELGKSRLPGGFEPRDLVGGQPQMLLVTLIPPPGKARRGLPVLWGRPAAGPLSKQLGRREEHPDTQYGPSEPPSHHSKTSVS